MTYHELSATERITIQIGLSNGFSQRRLARLMNRSPSTVSRARKGVAFIFDGRCAH